ncbi:helix-turn-helix domain-containing protein [Croceicoccus mobilis]|uniref:HTH cro/C1-type domain-containing protein n=1 Tax=Croceicoccus mobilis TaxID=1703339 RepID=A0A917DVC0_9SPHN|nr:helix-turn-helix transcriptional regulator [Croceicoccus mobilis]GGD74044.1 hypothetical protein GCM10010990_24600 [Croceicoccus mobilis]
MIVKLAKWRKLRGMTQAQLGAAIACSQPYVSQMERAVEPIVPGGDLMARIYQLTGGQVEPNDFYDLPRLDADRKDAA